MISYKRSGKGKPTIFIYSTSHLRVGFSTGVQYQYRFYLIGKIISLLLLNLNWQYRKQERALTRVFPFLLVLFTYSQQKRVVWLAPATTLCQPPYFKYKIWKTLVKSFKILRPAGLRRCLEELGEEPLCQPPRAPLPKGAEAQRRGAN